MDSPSERFDCVFVQLAQSPFPSLKRYWFGGIHHLRREGILETIGFTFRYAAKKIAKPASAPAGRRTIEGEVLGLESGDLVRVKSREEIEAVLDEKGSTRGLAFMSEMWKYCGQEFRVLKRLDAFKVEYTNQVIHPKNTVLLERCHCDGSNNQGCAASCYHFWREAWLQRVEAE